jgi:hypothetical protein
MMTSHEMVRTEQRGEARAEEEIQERGPYARRGRHRGHPRTRHRQVCREVPDLRAPGR